MRKAALAGLVVVVVMATVAALGVNGTFTYFSGTANEAITVDTANVTIGSTDNFPLSFQNLVPGQWQSQNVNVQNGSDVPADLYVQLISTPGGTNFCSPSNVLQAQIDDLAIGTIWGPGDPCQLFPGWSGSTIAKVGDDVPAGAWKNYRVYLRLLPTAGNAYQNTGNTDIVRLIAVQSDGPAPVPDKQGGLVQDRWPADTTLPDDDPNYP